MVCGQLLIHAMTHMNKPAVLPDISTLSFEAAMKELDGIVRGLESGTADLEKSIADYQRGTALKAHCLAKLNEAKLKVEQIQVAADGALSTKPFSAE
jgi:exodeoxyribonuclease VII small subunit